jgi:hypothetical protein
LLALAKMLVVVGWAMRWNWKCPMTNAHGLAMHYHGEWLGPEHQTKRLDKYLAVHLQQHVKAMAHHATHMHWYQIYLQCLQQNHCLTPSYLPLHHQADK